MKTALKADGSQIRASPRAPRNAVCPCCGEPVELRRQKKGWYYRHAKGRGEVCVQRSKSMLCDDDRPAKLDRDPYEVLGLSMAEQTVKQARQGNVQATLALAFSPVIAMALDHAGVAPEEALRAAAAKPCGQPEVLITEDVALVQREATKKPGPIFDLRPHDAFGQSALATSPWYVPLYQAGPVKASMVRQVLGLAKKVYVLGVAEEWEAITRSA